MKTKIELNGSDLYLSYFASIVLALVSSSWLADGIVTQTAKIFPWELGEIWRVNISAGLFFGISFFNPVGTIIAKFKFRRQLWLLGGGIVFGVVAQKLVFTPLAGAGMSNFLHLLLASAMVPLAMGIRQMKGILAANGIEPAQTLGKIAHTVAQWPERLLFIILMSASFLVFWYFAVSIKQVVIALAAVLTMLTTAIAARKWDDGSLEGGVSSDFQAWLDLEPEEPTTVTQAQSAVDEWKRLARTLLPGAILFGGTTRLAVDGLITLYPNLAANLNDPNSMWQTLGIVTASGLGLVFFGIVISLGFALTLLQMIGRVRNWTNVHLRENCYQLLRTLYFRPIKRT